MRYLRFGIGIVLTDDVLEDAVRIGNTLVLAQMLKPRCDQECLQETPLLGGVFKDIPRVRAVPPTLLTKVVDCCQKGAASFRIDVVFDRHQHWSSIWLGVDRQDRNGPMQGGREVNFRAALQLPRQA